eukprot:jgi/Psemu1/289892/fgenesh1_pg.416_\
MGWHVGMTYEEMKEQFGDTTGQSKPEGLACAPTAPDDSSTSTSPSALPPPATACFLSSHDASIPPPPPPDQTSIFHLCRKQDWERCVDSQTPYFPRTFVNDGRFTRASLYLEDMLDVANEYYWEQPQDNEKAASSPSASAIVNSNDSADPNSNTSSNADPSHTAPSPSAASFVSATSAPTHNQEAWIVLELDPRVLYHELGIPILAAVDTPPDDGTRGAHVVRCLQIIGGLSTHPSVLSRTVRSVYPMKRRGEDGKFVGLMAPAPPVPTPAPEPVETEETKPESASPEPEALDTPSKDDATEPTKVRKSKKGFFSKFKKS